jgi:membrane fusion protein (multidrug efflux system)
VTPGALVTANQSQALVTIQQLDPIYVDLTQSSTDLLKLRRDLEAGRVHRDKPDEVPVRLRLEDGSEYGEVGKLAFSEVSVDQGTGSVTLRAVFPNPRGVLLPGMYVRARVEQGMSGDMVLVPHAAVSRDPRGNAAVMVVDAQNVVQARVVKTERTLGDKWVVSEGLAPGERVIVEGLQRVRPGVPVQIVAGAAPAADAAN